MANMSYCRFQNTLSDLQDCLNYMYESDFDITRELSPEELEAADKLYRMCLRFEEDWENMTDYSERMEYAKIANK